MTQPQPILRTTYTSPIPRTVTPHTSRNHTPRSRHRLSVMRSATRHPTLHAPTPALHAPPHTPAPSPYRKLHTQTAPTQASSMRQASSTRQALSMRQLHRCPKQKPALRAGCHYRQPTCNTGPVLESGVMPHCVTTHYGTTHCVTTHCDTSSPSRSSIVSRRIITCEPSWLTATTAGRSAWL